MPGSRPEVLLPKTNVDWPTRQQWQDPGTIACAVMGALLLIYLVWLRVHWGGEANVTLINDLAFIAFDWGAALLAFRTSGYPGLPARLRHAWRWIAFAAFAFGLGNVVWLYYEVVLKIEPFPSLADAFFLLYYPAMLVGLFLLAGRHGSRSETLQFWLDTLMVVIGVATLTWYFLLYPIAQADHKSWIELLLAEIYPVASTAVLFGVAALLLSARGARVERAYIALIVGVVCMLVADTLYAYQTLKGTYSSGSSALTDSVYGVAFFFIMTSAQIAYLRYARLPERVTASAPSAASVSLLPYLGVALAYALLLYVGRGQWHEPLGGVVIAAALLTTLVLARQLLAMRENLRLRAAQAAQESELRFASLMRYASDVVLVLAPDLQVRFASQSTQRVLGYAPEQLTQGRLDELVHPDDRLRAQHFLHEAFTHADALGAEWRLRHANGEWRHIEAMATNLSHDASVGGLVLNVRDVTERNLLEARLREMAFYDPLTRLANRTLFRDRVEHALAKGARTGLKVAVLFIDLDNFKTINDNFGHAEGDRLLAVTAERLRACTRASDTVARLGGDEFAILMEDVTEAEHVIALAQRVCDSLGESIALEGRSVAVGASVGVAHGEGGTEAEAVLRNADTAMYSAKNSGKRGYAVFEPSMHAAVVERFDVESALGLAIEQNQLRLVFQPIVELHGGALAGMEALVRWHHPQRGLLMPASFIPIAEENVSLIAALGRWALGEACRQLKQLQASCGEQLYVSVNVSPKQLQPGALVRDVASALAQHRVDPHTLVLELTESALMQSTELALREMHELKAIGVSLAIDDFGMGYSSLSHLHRFPVDIIKIDKSFVARSTDGPSKGAGLARAIIALGETLQLTTVAEGIETAEQAAELKRFNCGFGQGYFYAAPMSAEQLRVWIGDTQRTSSTRRRLGALRVVAGPTVEEM